MGITRQHCYCRYCKTGAYPLDRYLGIEGRNCSEDLCLTISNLTAITNSFESCRVAFKDTGLVDISTTFIQKMANKVGRVGIEEENKLLEKTYQEAKELGDKEDKSQIFSVLIDGGRCQTLEDGKPVWKEVKMGAFCQYKRVISKDGKEKIKEQSRRYIGRVDEKSEIFGERLYLEALKNGYEKSETKVFIGDGATYNWDIQSHYFCDAIPILDCYHASEHLAKAGRVIYPEDLRFYPWNDKFKEHLLNGEIQTVIEELQKHLKKKKISTAKKKELKAEITYFNNNRERMRYNEYKKMGLSIGSGVIEAGIKQTVNRRIKGTEKHWLKNHANNILKLRIEKINSNVANLCLFEKLCA